MSIRSLAPTTLVAGLAGTGLVLALALAGPAFTAGSDKPAAIPCAEVPAAIGNAAQPDRVGLILAAIDHKCRPLPAVAVAALRSGKWDDGAELSPSDRTILLVQATEAAYPEAETLAVRLLESGIWPNAQPLSADAGTQIVRALKGVLTTYRVHLLLDVFEQVQDPPVRQAVIQALRGSKLDEAMLPALEAAYEDSGEVQEAGSTSISAQPEKTPPELHARLIRKLPEGALLDWAIRLSERHASGPVIAAKKARGIAK
jgi:hypothetical protein